MTSGFHINRPSNDHLRRRRRIQFDGVDMAIDEVPDAGIRALLGHGHFPRDIRARSVVNVPGREWPHTPTACLTDEHKGEWLDAHTLVCTGCGLDCT